MLLTFQKQNSKWETIKHIMFSYASESHMVNHQKEELFMLKPAKTLINIGCHISGGWGR